MSDAMTGIASGITAACLLLIFIGICLWTYSGRRRASFEASSRLPLEEDEFRAAGHGAAEDTR
jgi:cytochrome c oxidase cbb3-type subunit IV